MYLDNDAVLSTLREVAALPPGSGIVFDYRLLPSLLNPLEAMILGQMAARVAERGEPWKSAFDPAQLADALRGIGFATLDDLGAEELNRRYLARRKDGLRKAGGFRLICARR
jgi:O-methyltransferase involved in polyketide biosynthesis